MSRDGSFDERSDDSLERDEELQSELEDEHDDDLEVHGLDDHASDDHEDDGPGDASSHDNQDDNSDQANSVIATSSRRGRGQLGRGKGRGREDKTAEDNSVDAITGNGGSSSSRKGYRFELDGDSVINLRQVKRGRERRERIEAGESWTFKPADNQLVRTDLGDTGTEVSTYADPNKDGIFTRISEVFTPFSTNSTPIV